MELYLYDEGIEDVDFEKLKFFIRRNFGAVNVRLIKLKEKVTRTRGLLFDFLATQKSFAQTKHAQEKNACHIIFTGKLFATLDGSATLHIRAAIFSFPSVISIPGIVQGPAKPKEYYLFKQKYSQLGLWPLKEAELKKKFKGRFIDEQDKRLTGVIKGYIAQAIFFYLTGEPFCGQKNCRLFNSHWQEDLIHSQIKIGRFCKRHQDILQEIKFRLT